MIFIYFLIVVADVVERCQPITEGYVLSKYFAKWCPSCQKLDPIVEEISNKVDRHGANLKIRSVDCEECECVNIQNYPTLELSKDGTVVEALEGFQSYEKIIELIVRHTGMEESIFDRHVQKKEASVTQLSLENFLGGFDGPHVVLFYSKEEDKYRELFREIAKIYDGKLNVGEINHVDSAELVGRYDIKAYPFVLGIFNGLTAPFLGDNDLPSLVDFCDKLIEPSFQNLTLSKFNDVASGLEPGEPVYVVFHKNLTLASAYFQKLAHLYKFKARIYRSDDPQLFEKASIFPKELGHGDGASTSQDHSDVIMLSVYKNGIFYRYTDKFGDEEKITNWIFHTHYKYLTKIDNKNFYSIFHGLKPVMILLTQGEQFAWKMNEFSADRHLGVPYTDTVFATMEIDDYPLFIPTLLPKLEIPALIMFEPWANLFYHKKMRLTDENFSSTAMSTYASYQGGKLPLYPQKSQNILGYSLLGILAFAVGFFYYFTTATGVLKKTK